MAQKNLAVISKIILIYSFFFVGIKIFAIVNGAWFEVNLILCLPFVLLAGLGIFMVKSGRYSWIYVVAGVLAIGLMRYFERDWAAAIQAALN